MWLSFYHKRASRRFKKKVTCFGENTEKCTTFTVPIENEVTRTDKNGEEITKLLIAQDLGQALYKILSIIFLKEFIKLNVNMDTIIKSVTLAKMFKQALWLFSWIYKL